MRVKRNSVSVSQELLDKWGSCFVWLFPRFFKWIEKCRYAKSEKQKQIQIVNLKLSFNVRLKPFDKVTLNDGGENG